VPLNINATQTDAGSRRRARTTPRPADRPLVGQVVDELTAWNPREFMAAFLRWHQGSISLIHLNVLTLLEASGPMSMGRIADGLGISVASVTGVIDRMESRSLVERRRDSEDRRVILVHPGRGGRKLFDDIGKRRRLGLATLLTKLGDRELQGLLDGHRALRAARAELARVGAVAKVVEKAPSVRTRAKAAGR